MEKADVLIIGSGIAGLFLSYKLAQGNSKLRVVLLTKGLLTDSNSRYAQGGISGVVTKDEGELGSHIQDTFLAGGNLNEKETVETVIRSAKNVIEDLINIGVEFDRDALGKFHFALEGGHSVARILHTQDKTGEVIITKLIEKVKTFSNIEIIENAKVVKLLDVTYLKNFVKEGVQNIEESENECLGLMYYSQLKKKIYPIFAKKTVLCTGGLGQIFSNTTNPKVATGDGLFLVDEVGVKTKFLRYIQFHPTTLPGIGKGFERGETNYLLTEALRGAGAKVVDNKNNRFLFDYDSRGELATRDIITKAMYAYTSKLKISNVFLDLRGIPTKELETRFPTVLAKLKNSGFSPDHQLIPIVPAAHYQCGGVITDLNGQTSLKNLYAVGEVAYTGLHGSNRLASNSLLEASVFAQRAADHILEHINEKSNYSYKDFEMPKIKIYTQRKVRAIKLRDLLKKLKRQFTLVYQSGDIKKIKKFLVSLKLTRQKINAKIKLGTIDPQLFEIRVFLSVTVQILEDLTTPANTD